MNHSPSVLLPYSIGHSFQMMRWRAFSSPLTHTELTRDGDADLILIELASHAETSPAFGESQLRLPGDVADDLGLIFLADLQCSGDLRLEAVIPDGLDQDAHVTLIAEMRDLTPFAHPRALMSYLGLVPAVRVTDSMFASNLVFESASSTYCV